MSKVQAFVSVTDRSTKALASASAALTKVAVELANQVSSSEELAQEIQFRQAELGQIDATFEQKFAEAQSALKIKVLNNEDKVLGDLLKARGLVTIEPGVLDMLRDDLTFAQNASQDAVQDAVAASERTLTAQFNARIASKESEHKVAVAELTANSNAKDQKISFLEAQVADLRAQITAERDTRLAIAQAESGKQGVVVNTGK